MVIQPLASTFDILPAIDLRGGRVVRLAKGDFRHETVFSDDPVEVARRFVDAGARWLHVVDLDGARAGKPVQAAIVGAIVDAVGGETRVEASGGLRTAGSVAEVLALGAWRVALGTAAIADPDGLAAIVAEHGAERVVVAIDVRDGMAVGEAWQAGARGSSAEELIRRLAAAGVATFEVTAIDRDGLLGGPDLGLLGRLIELEQGRIIASGGIGSVADLEAVRAIGCAGAIVGRAIYDGSLDLGVAIEVMQG